MEGSLTLKKCTELCLAMESVSNDVTKLGTQEEIHYQKVIKKKNHKFPSREVSEQQGSFSESKGGHAKNAAKGPKKKNKLVCYCCGVDCHSKPDCKFKTYSCSNCFKIGYLRKVCKNKTEHVNNVDLVDLNLSNLYNLDSDGSNSVKPFCVKLDVSNKVIEFLVDTGSVLSVISKKDLEIGIMECKVKYKNLNKVLNLYVVRDGGPLIYFSVFRPTLGYYKHKTFDLILKENARPIFCKPRVLPFSLKDSVSKELDRLIAAILLVPVEASDWGTPIVPVVKADDRYPIPRVNDLMNVFRGATLFCTLDLCQAYQQLLLSKESQKLTIITTHKGLYIFKRLPYGVVSAPASEGTITKATPPCNVQEVKAFLGLVNYYSKFVDNMSSKAGALFYLLKSNSKFIWGKAQEAVFNRIKESILSNNVLTHYNTELELVVTCDASPVGLGAVLSHRFSDSTEKPIAFSSQ
ncbi:hypothetical protein QTP88_001384 [Uroleucon formosanum]